MAVFSVPKEILHIRTDGYNVLYNPEMHSWDYLTDEELVLYRSIQKNGSIDHLRFSRELQTSLFRFVLKGLLYHGTSPPLVEKEKAFPESPSAVYWAITKSLQLTLHILFCRRIPEHATATEHSTGVCGIGKHPYKQSAVGVLYGGRTAIRK